MCRYIVYFKINISGICSPNPCVNGGNCQVVDGKIECICPHGYFGDRCEFGMGIHYLYIYIYIYILFITMFQK